MKFIKHKEVLLKEEFKNLMTQFTLGKRTSFTVAYPSTAEIQELDLELLQSKHTSDGKTILFSIVEGKASWEEKQRMFNDVITRVTEACEDNGKSFLIAQSSTVGNTILHKLYALDNTIELDNVAQSSTVLNTIFKRHTLNKRYTLNNEAQSSKESDRTIIQEMIATVTNLAPEITTIENNFHVIPEACIGSSGMMNPLTRPFPLNNRDAAEEATIETVLLSIIEDTTSWTEKKDLFDSVITRMTKARQENGRDFLIPQSPFGSKSTLDTLLILHKLEEAHSALDASQSDRTLIKQMIVTISDLVPAITTTTNTANVTPEAHINSTPPILHLGTRHDAPTTSEEREKATATTDTTRLILLDRAIYLMRNHNSVFKDQDRTMQAIHQAFPDTANPSRIDINAIADASKDPKGLIAKVQPEYIRLQAEHDRLSNAATKIQTAYRSHADRIRTQAEHDRLSNAATKIQTAYRSHADRIHIQAEQQSGVGTGR